MSHTAAQLAAALTAHTQATNLAAATKAALTDTIAFASAAHHADQARYWRSQKRAPRAGLTAGKCEANARKHEALVREIAVQSEIVLARRARAQGGAA